MAFGRRPLQSLQILNQPFGEGLMARARRVLADGAGLPLIFPESDLGYCYDFKSGGKGKAQADALKGPVVGGRCPHIRLTLSHAGEEQEDEMGRYFTTTDLPDQLAVFVKEETGQPSLAMPVIVTSYNDSLLPQIPREGVVTIVVRPAENKVLQAPEGRTGVLEDLTSRQKEHLMAKLAQGEVIVATDTYGDWERILGQAGGLLVIRADGYISGVYFGPHGFESISKGGF